MTRRDLKKSIYPGYWESGAGGAVIKGENALEGAKQEFVEIFNSDCFVDSLRERLQDYVKCNL